MNVSSQLVITGAGYGLRNLGDEAFLSVMIKRFRQENPHVRITVLSFDPAETKKLHNVEANKAVGIKALLTLLKSDKIVLGGGGIFDTYVGGSVNLTCYYSLIISTIGLLFKKKIQFYAIGANSLFNKFVRKFLFFLMNRPSVDISVRDRESSRELRSVGVKKEIKVVMDPAVDLPSVPKDKVLKIFKKYDVDLDKKIIGFTLRSIGGSREKEIIKSTSNLVNWLIDQKIQVAFIPMAKATHKKDENDLLFLQKILHMIKNKKSVKIIDCDLTPSEVKGIINRLDLLIGMRFHSFIFAHSTKTPFIGISYSKKVSAFLNSIGEEELKIEDVSFIALKTKILEKIQLIESNN
ncbi:polysaccharide pyruvyl transferase family protein [Candidatus Bathyarchaeota archaeon]|nr:polysaccharide pyruvyl transferase family protein [Candidatus Bathyarchaeota archaeon]